MTTFRTILSLCLLVSTAWALPAEAATIDWKSDAGTAAWATGTNWVGDIAPANDLTTDFARFNQASYAFQPAAPNLRSVHGLVFGNDSSATAAIAMTTGTNTNRLNIGGGGILLNAESTAVAIGFGNSNAGVQLGASQAWTNNSSGLLTVTTLSNQSAAQDHTLTLNGTGSGGFTFTGTIRNEYDAGNTGTLSLVVDTGSSVQTRLAGSNNFTGSTTVTSGLLIYGRSAARGGGSAVSVGAEGSIGLGVGSSGYFNATAVDQLFAGTLSGITMNATSGVGIDTTQGNFTYATNQSATRSLTKLGVNTLSLSGTNTYSGQTVVNAGTLAVNGSIAGSGVTVQSGGTLSGSGSAGTSIAVQGGGTLAPGNSIESLGTGHVTFSADSTYAYEMNNDASPAVAGDLTFSSGDLTIAAGTILTLAELGAGSWSMDEKLTLISYNGAWNNGVFTYDGNPLADDANFSFSGATWRINYNDALKGSNYTADATGTFVTITVVPEPGAIVLLGTGAAVLGLRLVRRRSVSVSDEH
jgi:autotransporter-associated beta strand protein